MLILVVSDFHIGKGRFVRSGQANILEDFYEDDSFCDFLEFYSSGKYAQTPVHLVLNGDMLNLFQVDVEGIFPHIIDDKVTTLALEKVINGHPAVFQSLKRFLSAPHKKITYLIGNHDAGMIFPGAQEFFKRAVGDLVDFSFSLRIGGVYIEHGHRFEVINNVDELYIEGPNGKKILNLPWGSLFCISMLPKLKKEKPYIDRIRPLSTYIQWCFFNDFPFFMRVLSTLLSYLIKTKFSSYTKLNQNFVTTLKLLKQITIYPSFARKAKKIIQQDTSIHTVIMGHTHLKDWRRFEGGRCYYNTGTWNPIPSLDAAVHENTIKLYYVAIDSNTRDGSARSSSLNVWQGQWRPFREEVVHLR